MFSQLEHLAVIDPFAFEHGTGIMHGMGEDMDFGVAPVDQLAIEPDEAVAVVECLGSHGFVPPAGAGS